jgi:hypothetical protein
LSQSCKKLAEFPPFRRREAGDPLKPRLPGRIAVSTV